MKVYCFPCEPRSFEVRVNRRFFLTPVPCQAAIEAPELARSFSRFAAAATTAACELMKEHEHERET